VNRKADDARDNKTALATPSTYELGEAQIECSDLWQGEEEYLQARWWQH